MKIIKSLTIFSCLVIFILVGCGKKDVVLEKDYYVKIDEEAEQTNNKEQYVYNLKGYDENGDEKVVYFYVDKPYKKGTLLRVPRSLEGYTGSNEVIEAYELPKEVKMKLKL
ncbi:YxeA family protein [Rummeliibacillus sp. NPDC094406]|uniref:YxeA family protein n=1 Tax=Rummeliibacillus sp. NPDC094406 TaxID=3364511 RepID=UPI00381D996B